MAETDQIWVFSEKLSLLNELIAGGCALASQNGGQVVALGLGPRSAAQQALAQGADRVLWLGERPPDRLVDDYAPTLESLLQQRQPAGLLVGATTRGRAVAGRLAARFGISALTDVLTCSFEAGSLQASHMIFGGGAVRAERAQGRPVIVTVGPGVYEAQPAGQAAAGEILEVPFIEPVVKMTLRERKTRPAAAVDLSAAKKVVSAGRGLAQEADLAMVEELAQLLGAELACTRPLAEGLDWLPRERYIGISGATVKPDLYLGVGVSGQVQHMIGMSDSRIVVAINKDRSAPIFEQSDYGIVADLYKVVPALIQALKARG